MRNACLFVVKALNKIVEDLHNSVYYEFDSKGLVLRATDSDSLNKAKEKLEK